MAEKMSESGPRGASEPPSDFGFRISDLSVDDLRHACAAPLPHPDETALRDFTEQTLAYLLQHHETLPEQAIGRGAARAETERLLREPPPEQGQEFADVLSQFADAVAPLACRVNHPRFLAFI